jgi:D-3-phosphoglycerate dehydrogenase / 2-oxoglutarate reductase
LTKIAITSRSFGKINSGAIDILKKNGLNPVLNPYGKKLTEEEIVELSKGAVGIIAGTENIAEKVIESNSNLKVISRYGIGMDNIDLESAEKNNVIVYNTPETPSIAVAELTITLIFNLLKKIYIMDAKLKKNNWNPEIGTMLSGKTVGILGLGRIGKKVVKFLQPFNVKVIAFDISQDEDFNNKNNIEMVSFEKLLKESDIVTIHLPYNDKTKYIVNKNSFKIMKNTSFLINTARGGIIDEDDLYDALNNKKIAGSALDVFENEPKVGKLKELENIILTPHIATLTVETRKEMEIEAAENIIKGLKKVKLL